MRTAFHDPLIVPLEGEYLGLSTDLKISGVSARLSKDLLEWSEPFPLLKETPISVRRHVNTDHFWAPDLVKRGNKWRLYCCASRFGTTHSVIGLAESENPKGPYEYIGDVVVSQHSPAPTHANAIDPCVIADRQGKDWLIYGSFFGGIRILPLNEEGFAERFDEGELIAGGTHQAIEGAYAHYDSEADRYVLFTSWGSLSSDYHIRIGYSKEVTGPYLDSLGIPLTDHDPIHTPGDKLCGGYNFDLPEHPGIMATGHNSLMQLPSGLHMVHHCRPEGDVRHPFLQVRRLFWSQDRRLLAWPLSYDGNPIESAPETPQKWRAIYLSRHNAGVVYGRPVTAEQAKLTREGDTVRAELFHMTWEGYIYRQGKDIACTLISEKGESLWLMAE